MKKKISTFVVFAAALRTLMAVELAAPFGEGMVLQREKPVPVWGFAGPGEKVEVSFAGQVKSAEADEKGLWRVTLDPLAASCEGRDLVVSSLNRTREQSNSQTILHDILVGEVWLCSGQSNMALQMFHADGAYVGRHANQAMDMGYVEAMISRDPMVRLFKTPFEWSKKPEPRWKDPPEWIKVEPGSSLNFSAVGLQFAMALRQALDVPVGIVDTSWGNARVVGFVSREGFKAVSGLEREAESVPDDFGPVGYLGKRYGYNQPCVIWNGRIRPLAPMAFRGALWYQGEANIGDGAKNLLYLRALWKGWSDAFQNPGLPFLVVQVAPHDYGWKKDDPCWHFCDIWKAQAEFTREIPCGGIVTTVDLGELRNIHPNGKRSVALRLVATALGKVYGDTRIHWQSPEFVSATAGTNDTVRVVAANVGKWLLHGDMEAPFELAGEDGVFHDATSEFLPQGEVILRADGVTKPVSVRYAWSWGRLAKLKNEYGFPLLPFSEKVGGSSTTVVTSWSQQWSATFVPVAGSTDHPREVPGLVFSCDPPTNAQAAGR